MLAEQRVVSERAAKPEMRLASVGMKGADTTTPNGVIVADKPIRPGVVPCRSKLDSTTSTIDVVVIDHVKHRHLITARVA